MKPQVHFTSSILGVAITYNWACGVSKFDGDYLTHIQSAVTAGLSNGTFVTLINFAMHHGGNYVIQHWILDIEVIGQSRC